MSLETINSNINRENPSQIGRFVGRLLDHLPIVGVSREEFRERSKLEILVLRMVMEDLADKGFTETYIRESSDGWKTFWAVQRINLLWENERRHKVSLEYCQNTIYGEIDQNNVRLEIVDDVDTGIILGVIFNKIERLNTSTPEEKVEEDILHMKQRLEQNITGGYDRELLFNYQLPEQVNFLNIILGSKVDPVATQLAFDQAEESLGLRHDLVSVVWNNVSKAGLITP